MPNALFFRAVCGVAATRYVLFSIPWCRIVSLLFLPIVEGGAMSKSISKGEEVGVMDMSGNADAFPGVIGW